MEKMPPERGITDLLYRGGVYPHIQGSTPQEVLTNVVGSLPLPPKLSFSQLLSAVLERELLMPTAIGHGIALPHPKTPLLSDPQEEMVAISFLHEPIDWLALDGEPVHTAILILSASVKSHLRTLSWINFFCQQKQFQTLLRNQAAAAEILKALGEIEYN